MRSSPRAATRATGLPEVVPRAIVVDTALAHDESSLGNHIGKHCAFALDVKDKSSSKCRAVVRVSDDFTSDYVINVSSAIAAQSRQKLTLNESMHIDLITASWEGPHISPSREARLTPARLTPADDDATAGDAESPPSGPAAAAKARSISKQQAKKKADVEQQAFLDRQGDRLYFEKKTKYAMAIWRGSSASVMARNEARIARDVADRRRGIKASKLLKKCRMASSLTKWYNLMATSLRSSADRDPPDLPALAPAVLSSDDDDGDSSDSDADDAERLRKEGMRHAMEAMRRADEKRLSISRRQEAKRLAQEAKVTRKKAAIPADLASLLRKSSTDAPKKAISFRSEMAKFGLSSFTDRLEASGIESLEAAVDLDDDDIGHILYDHKGGIAPKWVLAAFSRLRSGIPPPPHRP